VFLKISLKFLGSQFTFQAALLSSDLILFSRKEISCIFTIINLIYIIAESKLLLHARISVLYRNIELYQNDQNNKKKALVNHHLKYGGRLIIT